MSVTNKFIFTTITRRVWNVSLEVIYSILDLGAD